MQNDTYGNVTTVVASMSGTFAKVAAIVGSVPKIPAAARATAGSSLGTRLARLGITAEKVAAEAERRDARDPKRHHALVAALVALDTAALWRVVVAMLDAVVDVDDTGPPHALRAARTLTAAPGAPGATWDVPVLA